MSKVFEIPCFWTATNFGLRQQPQRDAAFASVRKRHPPNAFGALLLLVSVLAIAALPFTARAHGELLIQIKELTRQIATNGTPQLYLERGELYREDRNWA